MLDHGTVGSGRSSSLQETERRQEIPHPSRLAGARFAQATSMRPEQMRRLHFEGQYGQQYRRSFRAVTSDVRYR